jgi:Glycosyl transferases group 1
MTERHAPAPQKSRLAIIAASAGQLERTCGHVIQLALKRNNAVLCAAPGLPIGVAADGPFQGASLTNVVDRLEAGVTSHLPARSETLKSAVADWRPDTILACGLDALPLARQAARQIRLDRIACVLFEEPAIETKGAVQRLWATRKINGAMKQCFAVIVADNDQIGACRAIGVALPRSPVTVIPGPGVDLTRVASSQLPGIGNGIRVFVDSDSPYDDQSETLAAIETALAATAGKLTLVAAPPSTAPSRKVGDDTPANTSETEWFGEPFVRALHDAHIHVQLHARQTFPTALMCALAVGRPILARDTPALRTTVDERVNGVLLPSAEPGAVAAGIRDVLNRPDLLASMARASRAKAARRFDAARLSGAVLDALMMR